MPSDLPRIKLDLHRHVDQAQEQVRISNQVSRFEVLVLTGNAVDLERHRKSLIMSMRSDVPYRFLDQLTHQRRPWIPILPSSVGRRPSVHLRNPVKYSVVARTHFPFGMTVPKQPFLSCLDVLDQSWNIFHASHGLELLIDGFYGTAMQYAKPGHVSHDGARVRVRQRRRSGQHGRRRVVDLVVSHDSVWMTEC